MVLIGLDASGKFSTDLDRAEPTAVVAAVGTESAFEEIATWISAALMRWGIGDRVTELHAKKLREHERKEVITMLAASEVRLSAVVTTPRLLGSVAVIADYRSRQRHKAELARPTSNKGDERKELVLRFLDDASFRTDEYLLAATLPPVICGAVQQALCRFASDEFVEDMHSFVVRADQETARVVDYVSATLIPTLGGDPRFSFRLPTHWREAPVHPLYERALHPDGDGLLPQRILESVEWVTSDDHACVQVADVAAWVLRRAVTGHASARDDFERLRPLFAGEGGRSFGLYALDDVPEDEIEDLLALQAGVQPAWWLVSEPRASGQLRRSWCQRVLRRIVGWLGSVS